MTSRSQKPLTWLITGVNSGFGLQLSLLARKQGHTVIGTARPSAKVPKELEEEGVHLVRIEITAPATEIAAKVNELIAQFGHIDVLVNNAGFAQLGAVEEVSDEQARYQFDVNFFGLLNFTRIILPHMRERKSGVIVQMSSLAGLSGGPGSGLYCATKSAVESISETLVEELKPFNIRVHVIEPGFFRTAFLERQSQGNYLSKEINGYIAGKEIAKMNGAQYGDPIKGSQRIIEVVTGTGMGLGLEWEMRVLLGQDAIQVAESKIRSLQQTVGMTRHIAASTDL
jgi:NAD(P)-dependent dehydrogenase (short-subunit alcohol dehydrogenase family)